MLDDRYRAVSEIKEKADIIQVVSSYITLEKKGANFVGICPFHNDSNPSLFVSPTKKIFTCFSCHESGDVFKFVSKYEKIPFYDAVKKVCEICNITPPSFLNAPKKVRQNEEVYQAVSKLADFYHYALMTNEGRGCKEYLNQRGLSESVIEHFKLGYAPKDNSQSINYLRNKENISVEILDKAGIISQESSSLKDRYHNRVMFPLSNLFGEIVGFSGRKFTEDNQDAKYINSPETILFKKGDLLYNFNNALASIKKDRYVYLLEGFMDVIACYRAGVSSCVGLMGTALSESHVNLFKKLDVEVRLCLDADEAGQIGTKRSLKLLTKAGVKVNVVVPFTLAKDADELLKLKGGDFLLSSLNKLELPTSFLLNFAALHQSLNTYEQKDQFLNSIKYLYFQAPKLAQEAILDEISLKFDVSKDSVKSVFNDYLSKTKIEQPRKVQTVKKVVDEDEMIMNEEENLPKEDLISSLFTFIKSKLKNENSILMNKNLQGIIRNESQLLAMISKSKIFWQQFMNIGDDFIIDSYSYVYSLISEYYINLTRNVECVREEDYNDIINNVLVTIEEMKQAQGNIADINNSRTAIRILNRLKYCSNPLNPENEGENSSKLITSHTRFKTMVDLYNSNRNSHRDIDKIIKNFESSKKKN